jgi:hypothetical protein
MKANNTVREQSGNAMFLILLGIVLFAALMFSFTRSTRQGGDNLSNRQQDIVVSDVLTFAQKLERAVDRVMQKSFSESDISFDSRLASGSNTGCHADGCRIFNQDGGGIGLLDPPQGVNNGETWLYNAHNTVKGVGCDNADQTCTDLTVFLPNIGESVCLKINTRLNIANPGNLPPVDASNSVDLTPMFDGSFTYANALAVTGGALDGKSAGCFKAGANYYFYSVLLAR